LFVIANAQMALRAGLARNPDRAPFFSFLAEQRYAVVATGGGADVAYVLAARDFVGSNIKRDFVRGIKDVGLANINTVGLGNINTVGLGNINTVDLFRDIKCSVQVGDRVAGVGGLTIRRFGYLVR